MEGGIRCGVGWGGTGSASLAAGVPPTPAPSQTPLHHRPLKLRCSCPTPALSSYPPTLVEGRPPYSTSQLSAHLLLLLQLRGARRGGGERVAQPGALLSSRHIVCT